MLTGYAPLEDDLAALSPIPRSQLDLDRQLRSALAAPEPSTLALISGTDAEATLQTTERLEPLLQTLVRQHTIAGFDLPSRLLPSRAEQARRQAALPGAADIRQRLQQAMQSLPFKPGSFDAFADAIQRSHELPPLGPTPLRDSLPGLRLSTLLYQREQGWVALVPLRQTSNAIVYRFLQETRAKLLIGGLLMIAILVLTLRHWRRLLAVLLPVTLTIAIDLAVLSWIEPRLNLFHLIALLLLVGLAIDYSLFFSRRDQNAVGQTTIEYHRLRSETRFALTLCAISTLVMFASLALSSLPVLHAIGVTVAIGVVLAHGLALLLSRPCRN